MQHGVNASRMFKFVGGAAFGPRATDATPAIADAHARGIFPERRDAAVARVPPRNSALLRHGAEA